MYFVLSIYFHANKKKKKGCYVNLYIHRELKCFCFFVKSAFVINRRFQHANAHARKVKEYFRKNTQKGYENLIFLLGDGLFCQQLW